MEKLNKYIKTKTKEIKKSSLSFEGLYKLIHNQEDRIFAEWGKVYDYHCLSYSSFEEYCRRLAKYYKDNIKEEKHSYIGIYMDNSINFIASMWALLMIGYKPLLINKRLPFDINKRICEITNTNCIISDEEINISNIILNKAGNNFLDNTNIIIDNNDINWEDELALCSTATSLNYKVCSYKGSDIAYQVLNAEKILKENKQMKGRYNGKLKQLCFLPFYHVFGLIAVYFWFSAYGRIFVFLQDTSPNTIINTARSFEVTHIFAVPLLWTTLEKEIRKQANKEGSSEKLDKGLKISYKLQFLFPHLGQKVARRMFRDVVDSTFGPSIKFLITGGGYIPESVLRFINCLGYPLYNGYGQTEVGITSVELKNNIKERCKGSVGRPFTSCKYIIENNRLSIKGMSTCSKIFYKDGSILNINKNDLFNTNDICRLVDKKYYIDGRGDDVIVLSNGEKINPDLIEKNIYIPYITNMSILNYNGLSLIIEVNREVLSIRKDEIVNSINTIINENNYHIEHVFYTHNAIIPPNAIKVSRKQLLNSIENGSIKLLSYKELVNTTSSIIEASNNIKDIIRATISDILNKNLTISDDSSNLVLDLGLNSMDIVSCIIKIEELFDVRIDNLEGIKSINDIYEYIKKKE